MTRTLLLLSLVLAACSKKAAPEPPLPAGAIAIDVTADGFAPAHVTVPAGQPVTLAFERRTDDTCAKQIVLDTGDQKIEKALPLNQRVLVAVTFPKAGELTYACGMDMVHGTITVQ